MIFPEQLLMPSLGREQCPEGLLRELTSASALFGVPSFGPAASQQLAAVNYPPERSRVYNGSVIFPSLVSWLCMSEMKCSVNYNVNRGGAVAW